MWHGQEIKESAPGVFKATPPEPSSKGNWVGYYVQVYFKGDTEHGFTILNDKFSTTSPGFTWPDTLPFKDCDANKGECIQ
jgi:hypothetical protein